MNQEQIQKTSDWWKGLCSESIKMTRWLKKLQLTEIGGYDDHIVFLDKYGADIPEREVKIITNIGEDEKKHSGLILDLMASRNLKPGKATPANESVYWNYMNAQVEDERDYFAVNYFGENLASERFEIICGHAATPGDIRELIRAILPDEIFHRTTLVKLAGDEAVAKMKFHHDYITNQMLSK